MVRWFHWDDVVIVLRRCLGAILCLVDCLQNSACETLKLNLKVTVEPEKTICRVDVNLVVYSLIPPHLVSPYSTMHPRIQTYISLSFIAHNPIQTRSGYLSIVIPTHPFLSSQNIYKIATRSSRRSSPTSAQIDSNEIKKDGIFVTRSPARSQTNSFCAENHRARDAVLK